MGASPRFHPKGVVLAGNRYASAWRLMRNCKSLVGWAKIAQQAQAHQETPMAVPY